MESAENSYMRATVTGIYGGLGYAVNFKNACKNCHADVIGYNNHYSFVLDELPVKAEGSTEYRTLEKRFSDVINVKDFGAVGDGTVHTVQEWIDAGKYASLAEIQDVCPDVESLDDYIDFAATSAAMAYIKQQGGGVMEFPATGSEYVLNQLLFGSNAQDITLLGVGARMHIDGGQIQATRAKRVNILGFEHIRFTREGNGISFADPQECVVDVRKLSGATGFQTIFYTPDRGDLS